jgi:hypothetical protein
MHATRAAQREARIGCLVFLAIVAALASSPGCKQLGSGESGAHGAARDAGAGDTLSRFELACLQCAVSYKGCLANKGVPGALQPPAGETCETERESCMAGLTPSTPTHDGSSPARFRFADCPP